VADAQSGHEKTITSLLPALAGANLIYGLGMLESSSKLIDRRVREEWAAAGSTTLYDRSLAEARRILETHQPEPLPDGVAAELRSIIEAAERELGVK